MLSLDESHQSETSEMDVTSSEDEVDQTDQEWERVPAPLESFEMAPRSAESYLASQLDPPPGQQGLPEGMGVAGGIMSSVASLWRAATSRMDHK